MINEILELKNLTELINMFSLTIPEGTAEKLVVNGTKISLSKNNGEIEVKIESTNDIRDLVEEYKSNIKDLDDTLFVDVLEEIKNQVDLKKFDELLKLEKFNECEASEVTKMIDNTSGIICDKLQEKIEELEDLYERFCR